MGIIERKDVHFRKRLIHYYNYFVCIHCRTSVLQRIDHFYQATIDMLGFTLQWRHNENDGVSNHQPHGYLLNRLFRRRSKKTSKPRVTGLCVGNSPRPVNSRTKGQLRGKFFHLMTSSWYADIQYGFFASVLTMYWGESTITVYIYVVTDSKLHHLQRALICMFVFVFSP